MRHWTAAPTCEIKNSVPNIMRHARTRSNCFTRIPRAYKTPTIFRLSKCAGTTTELQTNIEHANWHKRTNKNKLAWMHEQLFFGHTINFCHPQSSSLHDSQNSTNSTSSTRRSSEIFLLVQMSAENLPMPNGTTSMLWMSPPCNATTLKRSNSMALCRLRGSEVPKDQVTERLTS